MPKMKQKLSETLHKFLSGKRIIAEVARKMNRKVGVLDPKIGANFTNDSLDSKTLLSLYEAVRELGYGEELDEILKEYSANIEEES